MPSIGTDPITHALTHAHQQGSDEHSLTLTADHHAWSSSRFLPHSQRSSHHLELSAMHLVGEEAQKNTHPNPQIPPNKRHCVYTTLREICTNFCLPPCDQSREPSRHCSEKTCSDELFRFGWNLLDGSCPSGSPVGSETIAQSFSDGSACASWMSDQVCLFETSKFFAQLEMTHGCPRDTHPKSWRPFH